MFDGIPAEAIIAAATFAAGTLGALIKLAFHAGKIHVGVKSLLAGMADHEDRLRVLEGRPIRPRVLIQRAGGDD